MRVTSFFNKVRYTKPDGTTVIETWQESREGDTGGGGGGGPVIVESRINRFFLPFLQVISRMPQLVNFENDVIFHTDGPCDHEV